MFKPTIELNCSVVNMYINRLINEGLVNIWFKQKQHMYVKLIDE